MAEVRSIAMRVSVCLSVCLYVSVHSHVSKATCPKLRETFCTCNYGRRHNVFT